LEFNKHESLIEEAE